MRKNTQLLFTGIFLFLFGSISLGLFFTNEFYAYQETDLGTIGMFTRTGGRLQSPPSDEYTYPLGGNYTSPGNVSFDGIYDMEYFSIFHQVGFGRALFVSITENPHYEIYGASYQTLLNLTSWIHIDNGTQTYRYQVNHLRNLLLNTSTVQIFTVAKAIDLFVSDNPAEISIVYALTQALGPMIIE